jgi:L-rhamnose mutarotase
MDTMPSHEDANLILRLYDLRREETMRKARQWFVQNYYVSNLEEAGALAPPGSQENAYVRQVTSYWEMAASFVTAGVLNMELFFQSNQELLLVWTRVSPIAADMRRFMKSPNTWKNLEAVGKAYVEYWERTAPGAYEAFKQRLGTKPRT